MSHEAVPTDRDLTGIEAALSALAPASSRIDRDVVMFRAGQAASRPVPRSRRGWMAATACFALVAAGEAALLARRPGPTPVERAVVFYEPPAPAPAPAPQRETTPAEPASVMEPTAYQRLTWQVLRYGLDGLPATSPGTAEGAATQPALSRELLFEELRKDVEPGDPS
jgi:hypothetical protein